MPKHSKNDLVSQYLSLEAEVRDGSGSEEDDEEDFEDFLHNRDEPVDRPTASLPRMTSIRDSPEELERIAQAIKVRYLVSRDEESPGPDDAILDGHVYQIYVLPRFEQEFKGRLLALPSHFGITNVQWRSYLPGRLWISTTEPNNLPKALLACDIFRKPRRVEISLQELDSHQWRLQSLPKAGEWVRATRGLYKGDLALIIKQVPSTDILQIAVVPRIATRSSFQYGSQTRGKKRKSSHRPIPTLFEPEVAQTESFMEEQERVAAAQDRNKDASTQTGMQAEVNVARLLNTVEKLDRFATKEEEESFEVPHTLWDGTSRAKHEGEKVEDISYRYNGATFIGGLLVKGVCGTQCRLEAFPSKEEMVVFVHSRIWPGIIIPQFVAMHWKEGDKVYFPVGSSRISGTIVTMEPRTAIVQPDFDPEGVPNTTRVSFPIGIDTLHRRWSIGDGVKVIAGVELGTEGTIVGVFEDPPYIDILDKESLKTLSVPSDYAESFNMDSVALQQAHTFLVGERVKVKVVDGPLQCYAGLTGIIHRFLEEDEVIITIQNPEDKHNILDGNIKTELITLPISLIENLNEADRASEQLTRDAKSSLLNQRVYVTKGPDKGLQGEIRDASGSDGKLLVNLVFMRAELPRRYPREHLALALEGNIQGSCLDKTSDEDLLREINNARIHKLAIDRQTEVRGRTPEPVAESSMLQASLLGSFGASPAQDTEFPEWTSPPEEREQPSFLFDSSLWASIGSRQIRVRFADTYDEGRFYGKAITSPSQYTGPQGQMDAGMVALKATNKKTKLVAIVVNAKHIRHLQPASKNVDCVPLNGEHRGQLLKVLKINKAAKLASVISHSSTSDKWEEDLDNLCVVENPRSTR
ncbi:hypothetical protein HWV62_21852 [Athelia sp. TMB]|nr:hypothetical protein HWV62_21852 [Athelia sp. TMB]